MPQTVRFFIVFTMLLSLGYCLERERRWSIRHGVPNTPLCIDRIEGCFCEDHDNSCTSCNGNGCCYCDEFCVKAGDCCVDFTIRSNSGDICQLIPVDLVFVFDTSRSIGQQYFDIGKTYLRSLSQNLTIDESFQIALVSFSEDAHVEFNFKTVTDQEGFGKKLSALEFSRGRSEIQLGLNKAKQLLIARYPLYRKKLIVILTDGLPSTPSNIQSGFNNGITVYAVGIGEDVSHFFLKKITSTMARVIPFTTDILPSRLYTEKFNPICNLSNCKSSTKNDVILAVVSSSVDPTDITTTIPDLLNKILEGMLRRAPDSQISFLTFHKTVDVLMNFTKLSDKNKRHITLTLSSIYQSKEKHSNFSLLITFSETMSRDSTRGSRNFAQKILLIISSFPDDTDNRSHAMPKSGLEVFTIGLNENDQSFDVMRGLTPTSFHIGVLGKTPESKIDHFIEAFIEQLIRTKCT